MMTKLLTLAYLQGKSKESQASRPWLSLCCMRTGRSRDTGKSSIEPGSPGAHTPQVSTKVYRSLVAISVLATLGAMSPLAMAADEIRFATPSWPGATVKTAVASTLLQSLGYDTSVREASTALILEGMTAGDLDVDMALWRPSQSGMLDPRLASGELVEVVKNIEGASFRLAVPGYVWDAGVHSLADLAEHADQFDSTFYGIEAGNVGNEIMQKAIDENVYGLGDWRVRASSVTGMLSQVAAKVPRKEWIAFLAWEPHWMNVTYDLRYLDDPEGIWGKSSSVSTLSTPAFLEQHPNVARFLSQMVVPISVQNGWVHDYSLEEMPLEQVVTEWIDSHPELIAQWLDGVKTAYGQAPKLPLSGAE